MQRFEYDGLPVKNKSCSFRAEKATMLEKILTGVVVVLAIVIIIFIAYTVISYEIPVCQTKSCIASANQIIESIDTSFSPCDNFYNFACGTFMKTALEKNVLSRLQTLRDTAKRRYEYFLSEVKGKSHSIQVQSKYFEACMNEAAIELDGNKRFLALLEYLGGWPLIKGRQWNRAAFDHIEAMKTARHLGIDGEWFLVLDLFERYEEDETNMLEINVPTNANNITNEEAYINTILDIRDIFIHNPQRNRSQEDLGECRKIVQFENSLSKICSEDNYDSTNPPKYKIRELRTEFKLSVDWIDLVNNITRQNFTEEDDIYLGEDVYIDKLHALLEATPARTQSNYIVWKSIESTIPFLSRAVNDRYEKYKMRTEGDQYRETTRYQFCNDEVSNKFVFAKSADYLRKYMQPEKRKDLHDMVKNIKKQLERKLRETKWMDDTLRTKAISKLHKINVIIGGPDEMFDEQKFDKHIGIDQINLTSDNLIDILTEIYSKGMDHLYNKLSTNTDQHKLRIYSEVHSVNPLYLMEENDTLFLPVASLQGGMHDENRPQFLNYGTIGYVLAHEITHGLSDFYLDNPYVPNSTSRDTIECLINNCQTLQNHVGKWKTIDADKIDGFDCAKTVPEDFADYMGIEIAYKAYQAWSKKYGKELRLSGLQFTQNQLFWIINGSLMCRKIPPDVHTADTINHSPPPLRLLGYMRNSEYFKNDFHCPIGSNMNPKEKCHVS